MSSILDLDADFQEAVRLFTEEPVFIAGVACLALLYITLGAVLLYYFLDNTKVCRAWSKWADDQSSKRGIWSYLYLGPLWGLIFWLWPAFFAVVIICTVYNRWLVKIRLPTIKLPTLKLPTLKLPSLRLRGTRSVPEDLEAQVGDNGQRWQSIELDEIQAPAPARLASVRRIEAESANMSSRNPDGVSWPKHIYSLDANTSSDCFGGSATECWTPINTA